MDGLKRDDLDQGDTDGAAHRDEAGVVTRGVVGAFFAWRRASSSVVLSLIAMVPFIAAAIGAPALLSFAPTVEMLAPLAAAKAIAAHSEAIVHENAPFYLYLLMAGDMVSATPGGAHLIAKATGAGVVGGVYALVAARRMPVLWTIVSSAGIAAFVAAPFSGSAECALALYITLAMLVFTAPAIDTYGRALREGVLASAVLLALWLSDPAFAAIGIASMMFCPFWTGRFGVWRYVATGLSFAGTVAIIELIIPGFLAGRVGVILDALRSAPMMLTSGSSVSTFGGVGVAAILVLLATAILGDAAHHKADAPETGRGRSWLRALIFLAMSLFAARLSGAQTTPLFVIASAIAVFSTASPFYDAVWRRRDRASIALSGVVAGLAFFGATTLIAHGGGQFVMQARAAAAAPADIRAEFGMVHPGGPTIARWIEEGRFSTPEARELFALTPFDQSTMLLEAAVHARALEKNGHDVAILTAADTACIFSAARECRADGRAAADVASVVLVPRLDLEGATAAMKAKAEVLLYTEFKLTEKSALWEVWVRRGATTPSS